MAAGYVNQAEVERLMNEHSQTSGPVSRQRFVPRNLAMRMGTEQAAAWLDAKDTEDRDNDSDVFGRILGYRRNNEKPSNQTIA